MTTSKNTDPFAQIVSQNPRMQEVIEKAKKFALLDAPLLIQGETGTGKEVIAKACHDFSERRDHTFLAVNCAGIPGEDAETEMFGRRNKDGEFIGFFEYADGGTVLLDGVEELPLTLQAKLLRFLSDGTFRRVGEEEEHYANVRVICTAQQPLQHYVEQGKMRNDLFHRLNVLSLTLPLLRERQEDIALLSHQFIQEISEKLGIFPPHLDEHLLRYLQDYPWSGNLRELYNALYRACSLCQNNRLKIEDLSQKAVRWMRWLGVLRRRYFINFMQNIPVPENWPLAWGYLIRQLPINYVNTVLENRNCLAEVVNGAI